MAKQAISVVNPSEYGRQIPPAMANANSEQGIATAAAIEATDTYRVALKTIPQTARPMSNGQGKSPNRAPAEVAMPFPPLKPTQGE